MKGRKRKMSGRKQHFITQFLQRYFSENKTHICVYEKNNKYGTAINNNAAQKDFYSKPQEDNDTDKIITDFEGNQATLLSNLNLLPDGSIVNYSDQLKHLILTFLYRTKTFRENILKSSEILIKEKFLKDINVVHKKFFYKRYAIENIKDRNKKAKAKFSIDSSIDSIHKMCKSVLDENLSKIIRDAHNNTLSKNDYDENDLVNSNSTITIVDRKDEIILGDSVVIFRILKNGEEIYKNLPVDNDSTIKNIIVPISKNKLLIIGDSPNYFKNIDINKIIASCSREKFFASKESNEFEKLQQYIGSSSNLFSEEEYQEIINDLIREIEEREN